MWERKRPNQLDRTSNSLYPASSQVQSPCNVWLSPKYENSQRASSRVDGVSIMLLAGCGPVLLSRKDNIRTWFVGHCLEFIRENILRRWTWRKIPAKHPHVSIVIVISITVLMYSLTESGVAVESLVEIQTFSIKPWNLEIKCSWQRHISSADGATTKFVKEYIF